MCQICGKKLKENSVSVHMQRHKMKCSYKTCGASFTTNEARIEHVRSVHRGPKHLCCEACGKLCSGKAHLEDHVRLVHERKSLNVKCTECDKVFIHPRAMYMHRNLVHFPDKFKCGECKKSFGSLQDLQSHEIVHTGEKKFQCDDCGRNFKRIQALKDHKMSHTGAKPFACQYCPYKGASGTLLYHHRRQKHKVEFEEERKKKEKSKIKVSEYVPEGSTEGEGVK